MRLVQETYKPYSTILLSFGDKVIFLFACLVGLLILVFAFVGCSSEGPIAGGGSDVENAIVVGIVVNENGTQASNTQVQLIPSDYDPLAKTSSLDQEVLTDTTDVNGAYIFENVDSGTYNIDGVHLEKRTRLLIQNIEVKMGTDSITVLEGTLNPPGTIVVHFPESIDAQDGYVFISGTNIFKHIDFPLDSSRQIAIDSVPKGIIPQISFKENIAAEESINLADSIKVISSDTVYSHFNRNWKFSALITINTTNTGANISNPVYNFPLLVRLTSSNFNFEEARPNGEDIRFAKLNGKPIAYEIEGWNFQAKEGVVWVLMDTVYGNSLSQFQMHWGNSNAEDKGKSTIVFDTLNGFRGVWHLQQDPSGPSSQMRDASGNQNHGTPQGSFLEEDKVPTPLFRGLSLNSSNRFTLATMDQYVTSEKKYTNPGVFTLVFWVKTTFIGPNIGQLWIWNDP